MIGRQITQAAPRLLVMFFSFAFLGYLLNRLIPSTWITSFFGSGHACSLPLAATLGLPIYINSQASLPRLRAMLDSGMSQGAAQAFLISGAGTSQAAPALSPTRTPAPVPTLTPVPAFKARVAIGRAAGYDRALIRSQLEALFDNLGGIGDIVHSGSHVVIKTNLTGGNNFQAPDGFTPTETYATHPEVVRAVGELARDAGASQITIVEAVYDDQSYPGWGYTQIARDLNATLIDLNKPDPYTVFASAPVGVGYYFIQSFICHRILTEADAFISVAKMKCHYNAGITLSMKNLVGMLPYTLYRENTGDWWRSTLHAGDTGSRLPRILLDLNRARPIHLAVIDGVMTGEGGEAPRGSFKAVQPGVLVAEKNPVATDAVSAAVMSFDPTVEPPVAPFLRGDNYLNLARDLGLGTNKLDEIEVVGEKIQAVKYPFEPAWEM